MKPAAAGHWLVRRPPGSSGVAALVLAAVVASACSPRPASAPRQRVVIATGAQSGVYHLLGTALAGIYNAQMPDVDAVALETAGSGFNLREVEYGRADVAFTQADVGFSALQKGTMEDPRPYRRLRAIAVLYDNAVQIVALGASNIHRLQDLKGRRVGIGAPISVTEVAARLILQAENLQDRIAAEPLALDDVAAALEAREVDAGFVVSSYPVPAIARLAAAGGVRLVPIERALADRIRGDYPFFHPMVIPAGTYAGQQADVPTIGVENLLVCRSDLPDELVYRLTRLFIESLPALSRVHAAAAAIDAERASAAPIALHPGAARFYRERELFR